jgi:hypothetical protein
MSKSQEKNVKRRFLLLSILVLSVAGCAQEQCPYFSGAVKRRLEKQARWLVSESVQTEIADRSVAFGLLVRIEQCRVLTSGIMRDGDFVLEGLYFAVAGDAFRSLVGRYRGVWMLAVVPADRETKMPVANLLELTEHDWTLIHRDKDGSREVVAKGKF